MSWEDFFTGAIFNKMDWDLFSGALTNDVSWDLLFNGVFKALDTFDWSGYWVSFMNMLFDGLYWLCDFLFGWINIPSLPVALSSSIDSFLSLIFDNLSLLGFFIRPETLRLVIPLVIVLINFELIYKLIMWIAKKIPFLGIK